MLAFATASSSVALPVSMAAATHRLGVPPDVVAFVLPAGATIDKNGAAVYKAVTAVFLATIYGLALGPAQSDRDCRRVDGRCVCGCGRARQLARDDAHRAQRRGSPGAGGGGHRARRGDRSPARHVPHRGEYDRQSGRRGVGRTWHRRCRRRIAPPCARAGAVNGKTIAEQILSAKSGSDGRAGDTVVCDADLIIGTDASAPMAIAYFAKMGGTHVRRPDRVVFALDHYDPTTSPGTAKYHDLVHTFAAQHALRVYERGEGISHQLAIERGEVRPGQLVLGADSHTVTCGALNLFATGIGSSDLAAALITGQIWLRVPGHDSHRTPRRAPARSHGEGSRARDRRPARRGRRELPGGGVRRPSRSELSAR